MSDGARPFDFTIQPDTEQRLFLSGHIAAEAFLARGSRRDDASAALLTVRRDVRCEAARGRAAAAYVRPARP